MNPVKKEDVLRIYTDGASRGNPGPAACAFVMVRDSEVIHEHSEFLGDATNNTAEYQAIIRALTEAEKWTRWTVEVWSDSELVIKQINKEYRIRKEHLSRYCAEVYSLRLKFDKVTFKHVAREHPFIKQADKLCGKCLELRYGRSPRNDVAPVRR